MRRFLAVLTVCLLVPAGVALAASAATGTYRGKTSKHGKVVIVVRTETGQKTVVEKRSSITFKAKCRGGGSLTGKFEFGGPLVGGKTLSFRHATYSAPIKGGGTAYHTVSLHLTFDGRKVKGTYDDSAKVIRGAVTGHCTTGKVRVTAEK